MPAHVYASKLPSQEGEIGYSVVGSPKAMEFDDITLCNDVREFS